MPVDTASDLDDDESAIGSNDVTEDDAAFFAMFLVRRVIRVGIYVDNLIITGTAKAIVDAYGASLNKQKRWGG
eukprot:883439-Pleurochrysis_carterae.AAC.2